MPRTDPVLHRQHAAVWYAWGRIDQAREAETVTKIRRPVWVDLVDVFKFGERCATEAREYHDEKYPRYHLSSIQDQWQDHLDYLMGES